MLGAVRRTLSEEDRRAVIENKLKLMERQNSPTGASNDNTEILKYVHLVVGVALLIVIILGRGSVSNKSPIKGKTSEEVMKYIHQSVDSHCNESIFVTYGDLYQIFGSKQDFSDVYNQMTKIVLRDIEYSADRGFRSLKPQMPARCSRFPRLTSLFGTFFEVAIVIGVVVSIVVVKRLKNY